MPRVIPSPTTQAKAHKLARGYQDLLSKLPALPPIHGVLPDAAPDRPAPKLSFDADTFITTIRLEREMKPAKLTEIHCDNLFPAIVAAAAPDRWGAVARDFFSSLQVGRENEDGRFTPQAPSLLKDRTGGWEPEHLLREVVEWHWTADLVTRIHNLLGVDHQVDPGTRTITTKFWLYKCLETQIFDTTIPGGLDVDRGEIVTRVEKDRILVSAEKNLHFTDRVDIDGVDALALGRLLNYSAGAIVNAWMNDVFEAFAKALDAALAKATSPPAPPVASSLEREAAE